MSLPPAWLVPALEDPRVTDICINGPGKVFIDRGAGLQPACLAETQGFDGSDALRTWVLEQLSACGKSWDAKFPFVDASISSGHRLHVAFPPIAREGLLISLRRLPRAALGDPSSVQFEAASRWSSSPAYERLREAVRQGESVLISGATGSGKTTLANDLLAEVPVQERILCLEDTPELAPAHPQFLSLVSRPANSDGYGEITLRTLLKQTLRMRPDRIVLGECRGAEVLDLLQTLNTGHQGALATLHANSPRDALRRIELLCLLHGGGVIPVSGIRDLLAHGIQWITQVKRASAGRRITELWKVEGREGDTILMRAVVQLEK